MKFKNPTNDHVEQSSDAGLYTFLFGSFYFIFRGIWVHAALSFFAAFLTLGVSWLVYPFFAGGIVRSDYLRRGWTEIQAEPLPSNKLKPRELTPEETKAAKKRDTWTWIILGIFAAGILAVFYFSAP